MSTTAQTSTTRRTSTTPPRPRRPRAVHHANLVLKVAEQLRARAKETGQTVEAYTADALQVLRDDPAGILVALSALGVVAAQDHHDGAGPWRQHYDTVQQWLAATGQLTPTAEPTEAATAQAPPPMTPAVADLLSLQAQMFEERAPQAFGGEVPGFMSEALARLRDIATFLRTSHAQQQGAEAGA